MLVSVLAALLFIVLVLGGCSRTIDNLVDFIRILGEKI